MKSTLIRRAPLVAVFTIAIVFSGAGCTAGNTAGSAPVAGGPPAQTLEQACLLLGEGMTSDEVTVASGITPSDAASDPDAAIAAFNAVKERINAALVDVSEPTVKQRALGALSQVDVYLDALSSAKNATSGVDLTALEHTYEAVRAGYTDVNDSCRVVNGFSEG